MEEVTPLKTLDGREVIDLIMFRCISMSRKTP